MLVFWLLNFINALQWMVMVFFLTVALHRYRHYLINQLLLVLVDVLVQTVTAIVRYRGLELIILLICVGCAMLCSFVGLCGGRRGRYRLFKQQRCHVLVGVLR